MSARKFAVRDRLVISCSTAQKVLIEQGAQRADSDASSWALAHLMTKVSGKQDGAPMVVNRALADRLRAAARRQGVEPDALLDQMLLAGE